MEALLQRTTARIYELLLSHDLKLNTWVLDGIRLEVNTALMAACLIGRTEALKDILSGLAKYQKNP